MTYYYLQPRESVVEGLKDMLGQLCAAVLLAVFTTESVSATECEDSDKLNDEGGSPITIALTRSPFDESELKKSSGKAKDKDSKETFLGGAGFTKEVQALCTAPKAESSSGSKLVEKAGNTSKDVLFLLR